MIIDNRFGKPAFKTRSGQPIRLFHSFLFHQLTPCFPHHILHQLSSLIPDKSFSLLSSFHHFQPLPSTNLQ
ncbi:hypothetical protein C0Q70_01369 [Pomacea canaliculata]|uniref:Uncharacterized protein n=1 Tax=Pomacea canaliculata TaxID=400727 RepID=A0A2T7PZ89_POMCA|nr:hypothetical protein C0Q70_01369 [Pomacea canaliculata]